MVGWVASPDIIVFPEGFFFTVSSIGVKFFEENILLSSFIYCHGLLPKITLYQALILRTRSSKAMYAARKCID